MIGLQVSRPGFASFLFLAILCLRIRNLFVAFHYHHIYCLIVLFAFILFMSLDLEYRLRKSDILLAHI